MEIIRVPRIMQDITITHRMHGRSIGFVPTMGALHEGHLGLVRMAREENDIVVVSIYVNPRQFGPAEDFSRYPIDIEGDTEKLRKEDVDILFIPGDALVYPEGFSTHVEVEGLSEKLCGAFRPGHFRGVATVIVKLFNIVFPSRAYFGQKDFQQSLIIRKLVRDLDLGFEIVVSPTVREPDGLAMSSRNAYLNEAGRKAAGVVYRALTEASGAVKSGATDVGSVKEMMLKNLRSESLISEIQYCSAYDPETLDELGEITGEALLAVAIKIGEIRLIDNIIVTGYNRKSPVKRAC